jgi:hypothetical protein
VQPPGSLTRRHRQASDVTKRVCGRFIGKHNSLRVAMCTLWSEKSAPRSACVGAWPSDMPRSDQHPRAAVTKKHQRPDECRSHHEPNSFRALRTEQLRESLARNLHPSYRTEALDPRKVTVTIVLKRAIVWQNPVGPGSPAPPESRSRPKDIPTMKSIWTFVDQQNDAGGLSALEWNRIFTETVIDLPAPEEKDTTQIRLYLHKSSHQLGYSHWGDNNEPIKGPEWTLTKAASIQILNDLLSLPLNALTQKQRAAVQEALVQVQKQDSGGV